MSDSPKAQDFFLGFHFTAQSLSYFFKNCEKNFDKDKKLFWRLFTNLKDFATFSSKYLQFEILPNIIIVTKKIE